MHQSLKARLDAYHGGSDIRAYEFLGCHPEERNGVAGFVFRVWAPNAQSVRVVGDFNFWNTEDLPMGKITQGIWEAWSPHPKVGQAYKYLVCHWSGRTVYKADPLCLRTCRAPDASSVITAADTYRWQDGGWMKKARQGKPLSSPVNIYELHLGSWRRKDDGSCYSYRELAPILAEYVTSMGYTHVEFMPLAEYPYEPSWGYQVTHFYAPTSRYGGPEELKFLIDTLHRAGIGVILDWAGAYFPKDEQGLYRFDGSCCYELSDPKMNEHAIWKTQVFDYGKPEVRSFLVSAAVYWLEHYHLDGLRIDAVSPMLYLDFQRPDYTPNRYGGRENLEAIEFLRQLNRACFAVNPGVMMIAEESSTFPLVTRPDFDGGLGFLFKWNMGWEHDILEFLEIPPENRRENHQKATFSISYAFNENYILPLSHDDVAVGKGGLLNRMPGEYEDKFANLRLLRGWQMAHPGKKLCFMGSEFGQFIDWNFRQGLDWLLLEYPMHQKMQTWFRDLNRLYKKEPALWDGDCHGDTFKWLQPDDGVSGVIAFARGWDSRLVCVINYSEKTLENYRLGLPAPGLWTVVLCSDQRKYGGNGLLPKSCQSENVSCREFPDSCQLRLPPLSVTFLRRREF